MEKKWVIRNEAMSGGQVGMHEKDTIGNGVRCGYFLGIFSEKSSRLSFGCSFTLAVNP
jgi:hypothetical protein